MARAKSTAKPAARPKAGRTPRVLANTGGNSGVRNLRPWRPGQSGNPRGRPPVPPELRELARSHTETAIQTLVDVMKDKKSTGSARVAAACALLDRAHGRPPTEIDLRAGGLPGAPPISTAQIDVSKITHEQAYAYVIHGADLPAEAWEKLKREGDKE
jgi:hypothetical protein